MGMFDTISISGDLPFSQEMIDLGINKNNLSFQTKDLDCTMSHYFIQNGELFEEKYKTEEWIAGDPNAKSIMDKIGHMQREDPYFEKVNFHGENMKLNERLRTMLTAIAQSPRRANYFTHGDRRSQIHPDILKTWLDQMCEAGYCFLLL